MKRSGDLWQKIVDRDNLRLAVTKALRGKRHRPDARKFVSHLEDNLQRMADELEAESVVLGRHVQFVIHDPKERLITAPCFEERVVHHAMINVCEPLFERWLIDDSFACRRGKGREAAIRRAAGFAKQRVCFLKLDVRRYFDSISHERLLSQLSRRIKDRRVLQLFTRIVHGFRGPIGRGLPIGSLTSQHLANCYLGQFDRFVKETLRIRGYVRYMDDMAIWRDSTFELREILRRCSDFLEAELALSLKEPSPINHTVHGMDFLGCRIFATHVTLNRRSRQRFRRSVKAVERLFRAGRISAQTMQKRQTALTAFALSAGAASWRFRSGVIETLAD